MRGQPLVMTWNWGQVQRKINKTTNERHCHIIEKRKKLLKYPRNFSFYRHRKNFQILSEISKGNYHQQQQLITRKYWNCQIFENNKEETLTKRLFCDKKILPTRKKNFLHSQIIVVILRNHQFLTKDTKRMIFHGSFGREGDKFSKKRKY